MGIIKRGNYQFFTWIGDHDNHVHVERDNRLILKWDIEKREVIKGCLTRKIKKILNELLEKELL